MSTAARAAAAAPGATLRHYQVRIAAASLVGMIVSVSPILFSSFPVLLQPVSAEFGWGRGAMSYALMAAMVTATILYPFMGRMLDRFGSRAILLPGFGMFGLSVVGLSLMNGSQPLMLALYALAGATSTMASGVAIARAVSRVFFGKRGLMLGICLGAGGGIGGAAMPLVTRLLIDQAGWRGAYVGLGLLPIAIGIPTVYFLLREPPVKSADPVFEPFGLSARESMRSPRLWLLLVSIFLTCGVIAGVQAHFVAIAGDRGIGATGAAAMLSVGAIATMAGQLSIGLALDKVRSPWIVRAVYAAILGGVALIHLSSSGPVLLTGIALIGLAAGSEYGLLPYYLTRLFGIRSFGTLYGCVYASAAIANGVGPVIMGTTFDSLGSYDSAFVAFEAAVAASVAAMFAIRAFVYRPDGAGIEEGLKPGAG